MTIIKKIFIALFCSILMLSALPVSAKISANNLNPRVLKIAVEAYQNARIHGMVKNEILTVVDYSMPSTKPRMWVIDMSTGKVLYHTHVAHGTGSGDNYATRFSNRHGSRMSSLGVFLTGNLYQGQHGTSLKLHGLQKKYNSNALDRRIVVHAANYVDQRVINKMGRLGRSFGCLALNNKVAKQIMYKIKDGSVIFCYYPDKIWLKESATLSL